MPQRATSTSFNGPNANKRRHGVKKGDIRGPYKKRKRTQAELAHLMSEYFDGPEKDKSMRAVPRDEASKDIDPLEFMQSFINSEGMPKRDRLLASAQLAPYKHARRTGQYIGKSLVLPEPTSAQMAQEQIAMIARIAREGGCTMEESTVLIGHLESYIRAAGVVELGPRLAALEAREAARVAQGGAPVGLIIESTLPPLPGCESMIMPDTLMIEGLSDERAGVEPQAGEARANDGDPPIEDRR
jgi:hypothetical protein